MKKLLKFLLLSFLLLTFRYFFSVTVSHLLPDYFSSNSGNLETTDLSSDKKESSALSLSRVWNIRDSGHYITIVKEGYLKEPFNTEGPKNWAYYPLYPLLIKAITQVVPFGDLQERIVFTGILLSTVFFGLALFFLDKLLERVWLFDDKKYFVYLLMIFFPTGYFFNLMYPDSLFLLLSVLVLYLLFNKKYFFSSLFLGLAILTGPAGFILIIPFFYYFFISERHNQEIKLLPKAASYLLFSLIPVFIFYYHMFEKTGDFLAPFKIQAAVHRFIFFPLAYFYDYYTQWGSRFNPEVFLSVLFIMTLVIVIFYVFFKIYIIWEGRATEHNTLFIYAALYVLILCSMSVVSTSYRLVTACIPLFILPAMVFNFPVRSNIFLGALFVFLNLQTLFFILFLMNAGAFYMY